MVCVNYKIVNTEYLDLTKLSKFELNVDVEEGINPSRQNFVCL